MRCYEIRVEGIVQGVGFRPFIYRLAMEMGLKGFVVNDTEGVFITVSGEEDTVKSFKRRIYHEAPPLSVIKKIDLKKTGSRIFNGFSVEKSRITSKKNTFIPPDTALCEDCKKELFDPKNRRFHYPFTTCTHCGPRFSIISNIPYDRENTSMKEFKLCEKCRKEYEDPENRRFHTEPTSCPVCGPSYSLKDKSGNTITEDIDEIITFVGNALDKGLIVALKGVGGFHLAADSKNSEAVKKLRERKKRPFKPFAIMVGSVKCAGEFLEISDKERALLTSKERPIVLLKMKKNVVSQYVAPGLSFLGVMLPYSPFQMLLFQRLDRDAALIMTSGNISDEPIVYDEQMLFEKLGNIADLFVVTNREIVQQSDDSVVFAVDEKPFFIRRSRGFVPVPFFSGVTEKQYFAAGADLKNCFAVAKEDKIFLSQYIGDLESPLTGKVFDRTVTHFKKIFDVKPDIYISDLHPNYFSSKIADSLGEGKERFKVQHHHAHIASVLEDNGVDEKVIGLAFDGTGYGTDGNIWGSEFLIADKRDFKRAAHFSYFRLPGGEAAIKEVWRIALSLKYEALGKQAVEKNSRENMITELLEKKINSPLCCSVGRLFDGISSLLGISDIISTEAEAAQLLEETALTGYSDESFEIALSQKKDEYILDSFDFVKGVMAMEKRSLERADIAYAFHLSIADSSMRVVEKLREDSGINRVALSGGVFQNRLLLSMFLDRLKKRGFEILLPEKVPFNDGCIALGQIAVAKEIFR